MKSLTVIISLMIGAFGAAEKANGQSGPAEPNAPAKRGTKPEEGVPGSKPSGQDKHLKAVEAEMQKMRARIEARYNSRIAELRRHAEDQIKLLETSERSMLMNTAGRRGRLVQNLGLGSSDLYYKTADGHVIPRGQLRLAEQRVTHGVAEIEAELRERVAALEREKKYFLTVSLADREKQLKKAVLNPVVETHGLLGGIVYGEERRAALLDQNIVHEGEDIHGARVVRIYRRGVTFRKDDKTWDQRVGQIVADFDQ